MRFNIKPKPNLGDKKRKKKFAIFPVKINDTKKVWLESYYQHYVFTNVMNYGSLDFGYHGEWCEDYRETLDFRYSSKLVKTITINQTDVEKRDKALEEILSRI